MRHQPRTTPAPEVRLPDREALDADPHIPFVASRMLRDWHQSWNESEARLQTEGNARDAEFSYKMARICEILAGMVNPDVMLNQQQSYWLQEALPALTGDIPLKGAMSGGPVALACMTVAQYINSCHP